MNGATLRRAMLIRVASLLAAAPPFNLTVRRYVLAEDKPGVVTTEADNHYTNEMVSLDPASTALVMVDVWAFPPPNPAGLAENENFRMLPLLAAARHLGLLVVHAPSEAPETSSITVLPGEVLVTGQDGRPGSSSRCDGVLLNSSRRIRHVIVAGYDTNKCIIDKPCGIVALSSELVGHGVEFLIVRQRWIVRRIKGSQQLLRL